MNKEEIISYLKSNPKDLYEICEELRLRFPYENREELMAVYNNFKEVQEHFRKLIEKDGYEKWKTQYNNVNDYIESMETTYHIFDPSFDEKSENNWFVPNEYCKSAYEVFEFRKRMFSTSCINEDCLLDNIIAGDMRYIWHEKGGQDGMEESFPFSFTRESLVKEEEIYDDYLKSNIHFKHIYIRSYALGGNGGVAIIDKCTYYHYDDMTNVNPELQDTCRHSEQRIVTLGEDDGYHFLHGRVIYENCYSYNSDNKEFLRLLNMVTKEYKNYMKTRE